MPQISRNEHGINNKTYKKDHASKKKNKAIVTRMPCVTRDDCWTSRESSRLAEPVTPSLVTTEQAQAMTTKTTILLVIQK
jgi:hypothetical protein